MTNFEELTQDERTLASWMYYMMDCELCPAWEECVVDEGPIVGRCLRLICEWLKREA